MGRNGIVNGKVPVNRGNRMAVWPLKIHTAREDSVARLDKRKFDGKEIDDKRCRRQRKRR
jgi:hypothetical protein